MYFIILLILLLFIQILLCVLNGFLLHQTLLRQKYYVITNLKNQFSYSYYSENLQ